MWAKTIDEVIQQLEKIVGWARDNQGRLGYFAALYRKVTVKVKEGIADGFFKDAMRMERLDVIFANRYLEALRAISRRSGAHQGMAGRLCGGKGVVAHRPAASPARHECPYQPGLGYRGREK